VESRQELAGLRTATSKTFRNADGTFTTAVYGEPVHYRDARRGWREIQSGLIATDEPGYAWRTASSRFAAFFGDDAQGDLLRLDLAGNTYRLELEGARGGLLEKSGGASLSYRGALSGADLEYELHAGEIKETIRLNSPASPRSFRFWLRPPAATQVIPERRIDGGWDFLVGDQGAPAFTLAAPFALDSSPRQQRGKVAMTVRRVGGRFAIDVSVDRRWLTQAGRAYPVLVDPTIVVQRSLDPGTEETDANLDASCATCTVTRPTRLSLGATSTQPWRAALQFDLGLLPAGAAITAASLQLYYDKVCIGTCSTVSQSFTAHRVTSYWQSTESTVANVQFDATPLTTYSLPGNATERWLSWDVTGTAQAWRAGTQPNSGLLLRRTNEALGSGGIMVPSGAYTASQTLRPKLEITYAGDGIDLAAPDTLHSNGADLSWIPYSGPGSSPFQKYEVHRSRTAGFTPSATTLVATITDPAVTSYRDTTAGPARAFSYKVLRNTVASIERTVTLPADGLASKTLQPDPARGKASYIMFINGQTSCATRGAYIRMHVGANASSIRRAILAFDLRDIPTKATVTSASMALWQADILRGSGTVNVHRLTADWREGTGINTCVGDGATWYEKVGGVPWATPGGDFSPTVIASKTKAAGDQPQWDSFTVTSVVQQWMRGDAPNLGLLLKLANESFSPCTTITNCNYWAYQSDDVTVAPTLRPSLTVSYQDGSHAIGPAVSIVLPVANEVVGGAAITVSAAAIDDRRVDLVEFLVDGVVVGTDAVAPFQTTWNTTTATNGSHTLIARATDDAENLTTSAARNVTVENSATPTTSITAPAASATVSGTAVNVTASASGGRPIVKVEFYVDGLRFAEDTTSPYSSTWNTLDPDQPAYDGVHALSAIAYDSLGRVGTSADLSVTVANTVGTKYRAGFSSTDFPQAVIYDPASGTQAKAGLDVTVTNNSTVTWTATDVVLKYRWFSPDSVPVITDGPEVSLGSNLAAAQSRTLRVLIDPPVLPDGVNKAQYVLRIDLYSKTNAAWFASKGNKPLENPVIVNKALLRGALGLEPYYQFVGEDLGAGMRHDLNVANGNSIVRWTPFSATGRGLDTAVALTYNALEKKCDCPAGNNWSISVASLTRFGNPLDVHPDKSDEICGRSNKFIELTDADGTTHRFTSNDGIAYQEPDGLHLYLRRYSTTDAARKWALTTINRVTYFYDSDGFPTSVEDKNGNRITFTLQTTPAGEDPGGPKKRVTAVTDAGGRAFTITYWAKSHKTKSHVRGRIKRITDHSGSPLDFEYYEDGNLRKLIQRGGTNADGSYLADRSFVFTYTTSPGDGPAIPLAADRVDPNPRTPNQSTRLYSIRDPRGNETRFGYLGSGNGEDRWKLASRTDRAGAVTDYVYDAVNRITTVNLPVSRTWKYGYDVEGKTTSIVNPLNQTITQAWNGDRMLAKITEPTGKYVEFAYNANGLKTDVWDQLRNRTTNTYEDLPVDANDSAGTWKVGRTIPHISQLKTVTSPKGTATSTPTDDYQTTYVYDQKGNLTSTTDALGFVTSTVVNPDGTRASETDARSHTTTYVSYDANGLPTETRDAMGQSTRNGYDVDGFLLWTQDALHAADTGPDPREYRSYFDYDSFHRVGATSEPKSTKHARGTLIWTSTQRDASDNITSEAVPAYVPGGGARSTFVYDAMDRKIAEVGPDQSSGQERTEFTYDAGGRLTRVTLPLGVATTVVADDYVTETAYDALDRIKKETRYPQDGAAAGARVTSYCYDLASDLRSITEPRGARSDAPIQFVSCPAESDPAIYAYTPASYTTKLAYFADHADKSTTDPLGNMSLTTYDANGNVESETDPESNTSQFSYNARDEIVTEERPFDPSRPTRKLVSKFEYDGNGNVVREISERAVDSQGAGPYVNYVTAYTYDVIDQQTAVNHPVDGNTRQAWTHFTYNANGDQISASLPVDSQDAASVGATQKALVGYYDTGWIRTLDKPEARTATFDYSAPGWQTSRIPAGGAEETWTHYDDGQVRENKDPLGHPNKFTYDLNNRLIRTDDATGVHDAAEAPLVMETDYNGFDEPVAIRQRKEQPGQTPPPWRTTTYGYSANGNLDQRTDGGGAQTFGYDQANRLTSQLDANGVGCGDDRQLTMTYLRNGWRSTEVGRKSDGGCDPATWPVKRRTDSTYFSNGDLRTLETWKGTATPANLVESHTLEYEAGGVYVSGHRVKDRLTLDGPGSASCRSASCDATYSYDARERLKVWSNGLPGAEASTATYTLDADTAAVDTLDGNVTKDAVTGAGARTRDYVYSPAGQLRSLALNGTVSQLYFYDADTGNARCVTDAGQTAATCDGDGSAKPGLRDWYRFDGLDRMTTFKSYRAGAAVDSSYVYDAFDRSSTETEAHNGGVARATDFTYLGVTGEVSAEVERGGTTKRYSYDANEDRVGASVGTSTDEYSYARNPRGDMSLLVADSGNVTASYAYKPYGDLDGSISRGDVDRTNTLNPFRFNDKRFDSGSRTIEMGARRFEPDDGRFVQQDFLRDAGADLELSLEKETQNRYGFAGGNPVTFVEGDGHRPDPGDGKFPAKKPPPYPKLIYPFPKGVKKAIVGDGVGPYKIHRTDGLPSDGQPGHQAIDFGARAGTKVLAVVTGKTFWIKGGRDPREPPVCHRDYGWNFYLKSTSTGVSYFYVHLETRRVRNGGSVRIGALVATLANWEKWTCGIPNHLHLGASGPASNPNKNIIAVYKAPQVRPR
jgi:RHS repeat-associated protein